MKKTNIKLLTVAGLTAATILWSCGDGTKPAGEMTTNEVKTEANGRLPKDVLAICTVDPGEFKTWFADNTVSENGKVKHANSVTFPSKDNCSFYKWSEQMFLWLVSPDQGNRYTPNNTVLESELFYDVSLSSSGGERVLTPHKKGQPITLSSSITQAGPDGLPMVIDDKGDFFQVEAVAAKEKPLVAAMAADKMQNVEIGSIEASTDAKRHVFKDKAGKVIANPKPMFKHKNNPEIMLARYESKEGAVYLDAQGVEHSISVGQATNNVLIAAQNHSIIYYAIMVNDVYAYFLSAVKQKPTPAISGYQFPTTDRDRDSICAYARNRGKILPDSDALAMELKIALVEVTGLKNPETYITLDAMVPVYDTSNPKKWLPTKNTRKATLAIVGIHVVGSLRNHPEMSWATFEHKNNAPNAAYDYLNAKKDTVHVPADTGTNWLLCATSKDATYNVAYMTNKGDTIIATDGHNISASPTNLTFPFGAVRNSVTNPENRCAAASNSEVIGINNSVIGQLKGNDLRKHYILIGATWTSGGANPTGVSYGFKPSDTLPGVSIGTSVLANSTMETYFQRPDKSCFTCHHSKSLSPTVFGLSHIFTEILPLPKAPAGVKK